MDLRAIRGRSQGGDVRDTRNHREPSCANWDAIAGDSHANDGPKGNHPSTGRYSRSRLPDRRSGVASAGRMRVDHAGRRPRDEHRKSSADGGMGGQHRHAVCRVRRAPRGEEPARCRGGKTTQRASTRRLMTVISRAEGLAHRPEPARPPRHGTRPRGCDAASRSGDLRKRRRPQRTRTATRNVVPTKPYTTRELGVALAHCKQ